METIKTTLICALVLFIILIYSCDNLRPNCTENFTTDTIIVEKWDTVRLPYKRIPLKPKKLTPVATYTLSKDSIPKDSVLSLKRIYRDSIVDSNLVFHYNIETIGILSKFEPSYILKVPYSITHTIEKTIQISQKSRVGVYGGLELGGNTKTFNIAPFITVVDKKRNLYTFNYNLINKTYNIGVGFKISKK